jgi:hypothetical protein
VAIGPWLYGGPAWPSTVDVSKGKDQRCHDDFGASDDGIRRKHEVRCDARGRHHLSWLFQLARCRGGCDNTSDGVSQDTPHISENSEI